MSVFLAVDLDPATRDLATALIETHRGAFEAKWLRPDKLHCTLVFLGNPTPDAVEAMKPVVNALATRHAPLRLSLESAGSFVTARAPSVLWLGVAGALEGLRALQRDALQVLGSPGFEDREFLPHVTLARAQHDAHFDALVQALAGFRTPPFTVAHLSLYESSNHVYRAVHQAPLKEL